MKKLRPLFQIFFPGLIVMMIQVFWVSMAYAQPSPKLVLNELPKSVANNVTNHLALAGENCPSSARRISLLKRGFDERISNALHALGYYQSTWKIETEVTGDCWRLNLDITLGEPVLYGEINIELIGEAADSSVFKQAVGVSALKTGEPLSHSGYDAFKSRLSSLALRYGYPEAAYEANKLIVDIDKNTADVELRFNSGPRYDFGEVTYPDNEFDQEFLKRYQTFETGQPFDSNLIGSLQQKFVNAQLFQNVSVTELEKLGAQRSIPVDISLEPVSKHVTSLGLGVATDTGPRVSVDYENNRVNGRGHRYFANTQLSSVESSFDFSYQIPLSEPETERITYKTGWIGEDTDTSESNIFFVGGSYSSELKNDWLRTLDLIYQVESFEVGDERDTTNLLIPGVNWQKSQADNFLYPTSGLRLQAGARGGAEQLVSDISFLQLTASVKYIRGIGQKGRLITRLGVGTTLVDELTDLPASLRFFAGGDSSVRGFGYETLGPVGEDGEVTGGLHMLASSLEYEHYFWSNYGLAVFVDAGNAFDDSSIDLETSAGFGGRWRSPVGPIRIDVGFPLSTDDGVRLHLSMGADL